MNCCTQNIVKPPNKGHVGDGHFVPCREVVPFSEVLFWKFPKDKNNTILIYSASFDGLLNSKMARATLYYSIEYVQINIRSLFVTAFAKRPPLQVQNTEVPVIGIQYTSGRRGNV